MNDLVDLPFEEEPDEETAPAAQPVERSRHVYTVAELTAAIRGLLEDRFGEVWIEGEISNCRPWATGHLYFTLKDESAQIKAVMFRSACRRLRFKPEDGLHVVARARVTVYEPKGEYQVVCEHMEPHGLGALQLAFDQLKKRLQAEGLFDQARKRPLPAMPRRIGIVTSLDGAAVRDILKVLARRHPCADIVIRPSRVQGEGAAGEVARALAAIARVPGVDVVIVGRGGGSIEDLWAFNEEVVARAIRRSPVPVISAVGHETDVTIADFVADVRAPTPSAAAEIVLAARTELVARIERLAERSRSAMASLVHRARARVHQVTARPAMAGWRARFAMRSRHAAELTNEMHRLALGNLARRERRFNAVRSRLEAVGLRRRLEQIKGRLAAGAASLDAAMGRRRYRAARRLGEATGRLESLSPLGVLARGYAVCWTADRRAIIRRASDVEVGADVQVTLHEGELRCKVSGRKGGRAIDD